MSLSLIVAKSKNGVIGKDQKMPWHMPADLKYFKETTLGHCLIMGRKTFESIGKALPGRTSIVISRDPEFRAPGCLVAQSPEGAVALAQQEAATHAFVIGGGTIYEQFLPKVQECHITEIEAEFTGDTFFPMLDEEVWQLVSEQSFPADDKNPFPYRFTRWARKSATA